MNSRSSNDLTANIPGGDRSPEIELPRRTAPPLVLSLLLHVTLITLLGVFWTRRPAGGDAEPERPVGVAMVHRLPDRDRYVDAAESEPQETTSQAEVESASDEPSSLAPPADMAPPIDLSGVLQATEATPSPHDASGLAGDSLLGDEAFGTGGSSAAASSEDDATAMLFGVSGSGSRFVYVFDRSDSMNGYGGSPLRAAKKELIRSLETLSEKQRFQLIFYNQTPQPFRPSGLPLQLVPAEPSMLAKAQRYVESLPALGGTEHDAALKMALRMAPDVIFFLTDARIPRLSGPQMREIRTRAERSGTMIHAIEFGVGQVAPTNSFLRDLAAQNGGQYQYVDVRQFSSPRESVP